MADLTVIDSFTDTFSRYIDSGFGLLGGDVSFLSSTLVAIDLTLAGLAWSVRADDHILVTLAKKVLYVGAFAFIIGNFKSLAGIVFSSFSSIGLKASGGTLAAADLMRPGFVASAGFTAAHPLLEETSQFSGFDVLTNLPTILILLFCWILIVLAFFVLSVQLFVTLIEFKLTTLASFILVPFALWGKTAFLAEKTLGNVIASGVKVMVLAIIIGIGSTIFGQLATTLTRPIDIASAMSLLLAALSLFGLGIFGRGRRRRGGRRQCVSARRGKGGSRWIHERGPFGRIDDRFYCEGSCRGGRCGRCTARLPIGEAGRPRCRWGFRCFGRRILWPRGYIASGTTDQGSRAGRWSDPEGRRQEWTFRRPEARGRRVRHGVSSLPSAIGPLRSHAGAGLALPEGGAGLG